MCACLQGGLKAVIWTDAIQMCIFCLSLVLIFILGTVAVGGFGTVFSAAYEGGRLEILKCVWCAAVAPRPRGLTRRDGARLGENGALNDIDIMHGSAEHGLEGVQRSRAMGCLPARRADARHSHRRFAHPGIAVYMYYLIYGS